MTNRATTVWVEIAVPTLTVIFGMQLIRALVPYLVFLLGGRLGWPPFAYAGLALMLLGWMLLGSFAYHWLVRDTVQVYMLLASGAMVLGAWWFILRRD